LKRDILVSRKDGAVRAAVFEDDRLAEFHVERQQEIAGSIFLGVVADVVPGMSCAFVDIGLGRNALLAARDVYVDEEPAAYGRSISSLLKKNDQVIVQARKGPVGDKGARVTMRISIPGRYCVLLPRDAGRVGVSRKLEDPKERERLREIAVKALGKKMGLIVRTEAAGIDEEVLLEEIKGLVREWANIRRRGRRKKPASLWRQPDLLERLIRDMLTADTKHLYLDNEKEYREAREVVRQVARKMLDKVQWRRSGNLFREFHVGEQLQAALRPTVKLSSGGTLTVEETEACATVDVNTGKFVGEVDLEDTALRTNIEAAEEIARQLRLRDIGGIIVIDFIDMARVSNRRRLMKALEDAFKRDKARVRLVHVSPLGLVEMTRKRTGRSLAQELCETCGTCSGTGRVMRAEGKALV